MSDFVGVSLPFRLCAGAYIRSIFFNILYLSIVLLLSGSFGIIEIRVVSVVVGLLLIFMRLFFILRCYRCCSLVIDFDAFL